MNVCEVYSMVPRRFYIFNATMNSVRKKDKIYVNYVVEIVLYSYLALVKQCDVLIHIQDAHCMLLHLKY